MTSRGRQPLRPGHRQASHGLRFRRLRGQKRNDHEGMARSGQPEPGEATGPGSAGGWRGVKLPAVPRRSTCCGWPTNGSAFWMGALPLPIPLRRTPQQDPWGFARKVLPGLWQGPSESCEATYAPFAVLSDSDLEVAGARDIFSHYAALRESLKVLRLERRPRRTATPGQGRMDARGALDRGGGTHAGVRRAAGGARTAFHHGRHPLVADRRPSGARMDDIRPAGAHGSDPAPPEDRVKKQRTERKRGSCTWLRLQLFSANTNPANVRWRMPGGRKGRYSGNAQS